jgi:hypothetical protein
MPVQGMTMCGACLEEKQEKDKRYRDRNLMAGRCPRHKSRIVLPGKKHCEVCRQRDRERKIIYGERSDKQRKEAP